jgi:hypothetical protein
MIVNQEKGKIDKIQKLRAANYLDSLEKYQRENILPFLNGATAEEKIRQLAELLEKGHVKEDIIKLRGKHKIITSKLTLFTNKNIIYQLSPINLLLDMEKIQPQNNEQLIIPLKLADHVLNPIMWALYLNENYNTVDLKIDLTWDKKDLIKAFDDLITSLQKKIKKQKGKGKRKDVRTTEIRTTIENELIKNYVKNGFSLEKSLEACSKKLNEYGFKRDPDSIKRRYLPKIKKKYGIRRINDLRSKIKGDK